MYDTLGFDVGTMHACVHRAPCMYCNVMYMVPLIKSRYDVSSSSFSLFSFLFPFSTSFFYFLASLKGIVVVNHLVCKIVFERSCTSSFMDGRMCIPRPALLPLPHYPWSCMLYPTLVTPFFLHFYFPFAFLFLLIEGSGGEPWESLIIVLFVLYLKGFTKGGYQFGKCC